MQSRLKDIAEIQFGPYDKGTVKGEAKYLMASHFDRLFKLTKFELSYVDITPKNEKGLLRENDVILAGKGQRSFAWAYDEKHGLCIPSSLFFIIRVDDKRINSRYLTSYLNSERVQSRLQLIGAGATIPSIPKKELNQLQVNIPSLEEQQRIVAMAEMLEEDIRLTEQLLERKRAMRRTIMNRLLTNEKQE